MKYINQAKTLKILTALCAVAAISLSTVANAKTTRTTKVYVDNKTGRDIEFVTVNHKYSDVFKEEKVFRNIGNNRRANDYLSVRYNTGFGTTGVDWWQVSWKYKGDSKLYFTEPNNFRHIFDAIEGVILKATDKVDLAKDVSRLFFNNESTVGFKRHFLTAEDQAGGMVITITQPSVIFQSKSGRSSTEGIKSRVIPTSMASASSCADAVQGKIAWDYNGNKGWSQTNVNKLCGSVATVEPAKCFNKVMHGGVNWGGSDKWQWSNALNLCQSSANADRTVQCFVGKVGSSGWSNAINNCKS